MDLEATLDIYFEKWSELENVGGINGRKFRCQTNNNKDIFIKCRKKKDWDWFEWGLRKEYRICNKLGDNLDYVPESILLTESDNFVIVGFEYIENTDIKYRDLYQKNYDLESILDSINSVLTWLYKNSNKLSVPINNMKNREQVSGNKSFQSMKEYIINERLRDEVYFGNEYYDEYKNDLNNIADILDNFYDNDRVRLIHGDIQNPNNIIFTKDGIRGIIDWEISGWFDYLYDISFVESMFIDKPCKYSNKYNRDNLVSVLYKDLNIDSKDKNIIDLYKIWPHYLELEYLYSRDSIYGDYSIKYEMKLQKELLDNRIQSLDI